MDVSSSLSSPSHSSGSINQSNSACQVWTPTPNLIQTSIFFTLAILTVTGNGLLIAVVIRTKSLRTKSNYLITSLAMADFLQGLISDMIWGCAIWIHDQSYIEVAKFVIHFSSCATTWHIFAVTIERYIAVCKPFHYKSVITSRNLTIALLIIWTYSITFAALHFVWRDYTYWVALSWTGIILLFIMVGLHTAIFYRLRRVVTYRKGSNMNVLLESRAQVEAVKIARHSERKTAKLMGIITMVFAICNIPSFIAENLVYFCLMSQQTKNMINLAFLIGSFLNPIIYAFRVRDFRHALLKLCCSCVSRGGHAGKQMVPAVSFSSLMFTSDAEYLQNHHAQDLSEDDTHVTTLRDNETETVTFKDDPTSDADHLQSLHEETTKLNQNSFTIHSSAPVICEPLITKNNNSQNFMKRAQSCIEDVTFDNDYIRQVSVGALSDDLGLHSRHKRHLHKIDAIHSSATTISDRYLHKRQNGPRTDPSAISYSELPLDILTS